MKVSRRAAYAVLGATLLVPTTTVLAAKVTSKVVNTQDLLNPVWNEAKDPSSHRYTFREPSPSVPPDARVLRGHFSKELCIAALGEADAPPPKKSLRVIVQGGRTDFVTLVVAPGQELLFENHDPTEHALYEVGGKLTKSVMKPEGNIKWTPPGPGKYELRDELFPSLRSFIVVEPKLTFRPDGSPNVFFPTRKGDLAMELEPGNYTLVSYFNGEPVGDKTPLEVKPAPPEQPMKDPIKAGADKKSGDKKDEPAKDGKDPAKKEEPAKAGG